jgi:hypothetical protein
MPCTHIESAEEIALAAEQQALNTSAYKKQKKKLDEVTALLCSACQFLLSTNFPLKKQKDLWRWWTEHQVMDEDRIRREALAKLSPEERKVLKIK